MGLDFCKDYRLSFYVSLFLSSSAYGLAPELAGEGVGLVVYLDFTSFLRVHGMASSTSSQERQGRCSRAFQLD
jgi:hypothetical protein